MRNGGELAMNNSLRNTQPLYLRIHSNLKKRLEAGEWGLGAMLPSENELCEYYSISRGTMRQVLAELEKEGLIRRERGRGTFVNFGPQTSGLSPIFSQMISFIVPYVRDSFVSSILLGLEREARVCGYSVLFNHVENDIKKQDQAIRAAMQKHVAGIVLYPVNSRDLSPILLEITEKNYPVVLVDRYIRGLYIDYVTSDNFGGGMIATQHLLSLGHRRVAFLNWVEMATTMEQRRAGYRQALVESAIPLDPSLEWEVEGYPEIDSTALEERLRQAGRPSAIFAANDQLALAVQRAARSIGLVIPRDLALVGYDDLEISSHLDIPLTTIAQPAHEIGCVAWNILYAKISKTSGGIQRQILPVKLMVRGSCGANVTTNNFG